MPRKFRNVVWLAWLVLAAAASAQSFRWEVEYFRSPGPLFYTVLLCALPILLAACALYVRVRTARLCRLEIPALAIFCGLSALFYQPLATVVAALLFVACLSAGLRLAHPLQIPLESNIETIALGFALGGALLMPVLFALGMLHAFYPAVLLVLLALPCLLFRSHAWRGLAAVRQTILRAASFDSLRHPMAGLAFFFLVPAALCALGVMLSPSIAFDPLAMHLASARVYAAEHAVRPLPSLDYSYYPQGAEVWMALGYSLGGQPAAQTVAPLFWILFLLLLAAIARACEMTKPAALVGVAAVVMLPFVHWTGANSKNDLMMVFFQASALYAFIRWTKSRAPAWILAGALFLGSAFSVKHVALFGAIPLLGFFFYALWQSSRRVRMALAFMLILAASGLYWHVRTFLLTGNPVYPERMGQSVESVGKHVNPKLGRIARLWEVPWRAHFDGQRAFQSPLPNPVGLIFLAFLPLSILIPPAKAPGLAARRACLLFSVSYLAYWAMIIGEIRYAILPVSLLVLLLAGKAMAFYDQAGRAIRLSVAAALAGVLLFAILGIAIIEVNAPEPLLLSGRIDSATYLKRALRTYGSLAWLNQNHVESTVFAVENCSRAYAPDPAKFFCVFQVRGQAMKAGFVILPEGRTAPPAADLTYRDAFFSVYRMRGAE
jgi:hypothetical protein